MRGGLRGTDPLTPPLLARAPADTNASLVLSTVRGDGLTLQPDRPLTTMDAALLAVFSGGGVPDVRSTWTAYLGHSYRWHHVLAAQLGGPFELSLSDLGPAGAAPRFAVVDWFSHGILTILAAANDTFVVPHGQGQPSAPAAAHSIQHFTVIPQLPGGWWLYGEAGKVVPMSKQRVPDIALLADGFSATVLGAAGEKAVPMLVVQPGGSALVEVACPSGVAGASSTLTCSSAAPSCTCT